jgi:hypothetical protein
MGFFVILIEFAIYVYSNLLLCEIGNLEIVVHWGVQKEG